MDCEFSKLLSAYHDGELPDEQRRQLETHLPACATCSAELNEMRSLSRVLQSYERPRLDADARQRLHAMVEDVPEQTIVRFVWRVAAIAASIMLIGATWLEVNSVQAQAEPPPGIQSWETAVTDPGTESLSLNESGDAQLASLIVNDTRPAPASENRQ